MAEEVPVPQITPERRRKRRRRRSGRPTDGGNEGSNENKRAHSPRQRGRRQHPPSGPELSLPSSGQNPHRKRNSRPRRGAPGFPSVRYRRPPKSDVSQLRDWLARLNAPILGQLYRGLGGQPGRVNDPDRVVQLTLKALTQSGRMGTALKAVQQRHRQALAALLQCGALAHTGEFHRELALSLGGQEREWQKVVETLAEKGLVLAAHKNDGQHFYVVPEPFIDPLLAELQHELSLPIFNRDDVRIIDERAFCPPFDFSITSLATYIDQNGPRLTQRQEIYRTDREEMNRFFAQLWTDPSELFSFHLDFLMMHGMVELKGEFLSLNRDATEEWLQLEPEDQRDLLFRALEVRFSMGEWVMWAIDQAGEGWVAEQPLMTLYRRWRRGENWRNRFQSKNLSSGKRNERESFSFAPLVQAGMLDMGQWGQEKFYRLSPRGRALLHPQKDDGFTSFYLTPSFEIMAPAGLAPILLFRIGELAELTGCDRANTYRITEISVERAMERGWRRDDVLQFLGDNSQIGLPENVEATLKGWIGHRGDVEFHDLTMVSVHRSQLRRFESSKKIKPYILHRFAPGLYAIDRSRREDLAALLQELGFSPNKEVRNYPGAPEQVEARAKLQTLISEAREMAIDSKPNGFGVVPPEAITAVSGTKLAKVVLANAPKIPIVDAERARLILDEAMVRHQTVEMLYLSKTGHRITCSVEPHRIAFKGGSPVLVGLDKSENERRTYSLDRIEGIRVMEV